MTESIDGDRHDASETTVARRLVLARPHPDETVEEFSARFLDEILDAQRLQKQSGSDRG